MIFQSQWIRLLFLFVTFDTFRFSRTVYDSNGNVGELPFCAQEGLKEKGRRLILVSTLDGKLSALSIDDGGAEQWTVPTGPGTMLSSSIHRLELTNNGQWVRMIPSLSGGLYKFNGENIEAIPITADNLLRASFKYSDDLVISGGKESRTYGVEIDTGRVLYECSLAGCDGLDDMSTAGDVVLVQRQTQTVRAVEPRTGIERWNFSVGQHEVKMAPGPMVGCHSLRDTRPDADVVVKVIVPEGLVCAVSKSRPGLVLWTHKFEAPVVSAWRLASGQVEDVDLFSGAQPPPTPDDQPLPSSPLLYVGMHQKQLYIQESVSMMRKLHGLDTLLGQHLLTDERRFPQIPWRPVLVTGTALGLPGSVDNLLTSDSSNDDSNETTAMSVLYGSEYVNGNGYYLYNDDVSADREVSSDRADSLCPRVAPAAPSTAPASPANTTNTTETVGPTIPSPDDGGPMEFTHNQIFVVSLWFWWKEVFMISVTTAVLVNLFIQRRMAHTFNFPSNQIMQVRRSLRSYSSRDSGRSSTTSPLTPSLPLRASSDSFESRFLTDFIPVHCLGKGGFGVVFEAKNKIDDCHYAIKRIPLPNSKESRERVMREVKALAKLDHQNIVRYFNAWLECPPPGWQESVDKGWLAAREMVGSSDGVFSVDLTSQDTPNSERSVGHVINRNRLRPQSLQHVSDWPSQSAELPPRAPLTDDDNDSYIVFGSPSREPSEVPSEDVFEEDAAKNDGKLDSAITISSETSANTTTDVTDVEQTDSPKRPNTLALRAESPNGFNSSRMYLFIQMQLCKKKSLKDWLKDNIAQRPRSSVLNIFNQIVQAVEYVHMQGLIHRDLKPSNIFFSPDGQVKVGDFGLVTAMAESPVDIWVSVEGELDSWADEKHTARVGTQLYMSPEQLSGKPYSYKVDIYSLGVILFELLVPFNTQMERIHTLTNLRANKYPEHFHTKFNNEYELLKMMLSHRPDERPTTYGIRARPPLNCDSPLNAASEWHFELPNRRRSSNSISKTSSGSSVDS